MADRYFVEPPITAQNATLIGAEAHHLAHVMRARRGTEVTLFDGSGAEFNARVLKIERSLIELEILARAEVDRELPLRVSLAVALPKGDRQRWLVEKAVELGAQRLVPLVTERSIAEPATGTSARLRRSAIEASKQCGRNRLMEIAPPQSLADFVAACPDDSLRLAAHPGGAPWGRALAERRDVLWQSRNAFLAAGPEGGFTNAEIDQFVAGGWQLVDLGPSILRIETAALALCAVIAAHCRSGIDAGSGPIESV